RKREAAERGFKGARQRVVDANIVEIGRRIAADRQSARRIAKPAGTALDVHRFGLGAVHELAVLQGAQDRFSARTAAISQVLDAGCSFAEIVGGEMPDRLVKAWRTV